MDGVVTSVGPSDEKRKRVTSRDIARMANVSQATVSRVLNNKGTTSEETRQRVLKAVRDSNYSPNEAARSLITRRANAIGIVVEDIRNPFYPELVSDLSEIVAASKLQLLLWKAADGEPADDQLYALRRRLVDGMVFTAATLDSVAVRELSAQGYPIVLANRTIDGSECDSVSLDDLEGGRLAARHLLARGNRSIAVIGGNENTSTYRDRSRGLSEAFAAQGLEEGQYFFVPGAYDYESGYASTLAILQSRPDVTAVVGMNDIVAIGSLNAARALGSRVPDDLEIIGFDNIAMAGWPLVQLSTVASAERTLASVAMELLLDRIKNPSAPVQRIKLRPRLNKRQTTKSPPA